MKKINWGVLSTAKIAKQHVIPGIKRDQAISMQLLVKIMAPMLNCTKIRK